MSKPLEKLKTKALGRPAVRKAYDELEDEFSFFDELMRARNEAGMTQAAIAARIGTTQSAIARLESSLPKHSPTIATLQKYARALGYRVEVRLVKARKHSRP